MGGGIHLELATKLLVLKSGNDYTKTIYNLCFIKNSADYGGAIYNADETENEVCASKSYYIVTVVVTAQNASCKYFPKCKQFVCCITL